MSALGSSLSFSQFLKHHESNATEMASADKDTHIGFATNFEAWNELVVLKNEGFELQGVYEGKSGKRFKPGFQASTVSDDC